MLRSYSKHLVYDPSSSAENYGLNPNKFQLIFFPFC